MAKVTSKYQISIPKALAERVGIRVGDELDWENAAGTLRVRIATAAKTRLSVRERLRLGDVMQPAGKLVLPVRERLHPAAQRGELRHQRIERAGRAAGGAQHQEQQHDDQRRTAKPGQDQRIVQGGKRRHVRPNSRSMSLSFSST